MKSENVYETRTLKVHGDAFELACLCKKGEVEKDWVWLEFNEIKDKKYPEQNMVWDNSSYIFEEFYSFLKRWKERQISDEDKIEFADVLDYLNEDKVEDLIELLETAKKLNWNE